MKLDIDFAFSRNSMCSLFGLPGNTEIFVSVFFVTTISMCYQTQGFGGLDCSRQEPDVVVLRWFYLLAASKGDRAFTSKALSLRREV